MAHWRFAKYHGLGNDFVIADLREGDAHHPSPQDPAVVREICDRNFGVGADGVLVILPPTRPGADARMRTMNADGSEAEMCGNGIRCVAKYLYDRVPAMRKNDLPIETMAGILVCGITPGKDGLAATVSVDMGPPRMRPSLIPMAGVAEGLEQWVDQPLEVAGRTFRFTALSMGNPHAVTFVDETGPALRALAERIGPIVETHALFPRKTNVEFVHRTRASELEVVVWERGVGITSACGTGACAVTKAAVLLGHVIADSEVTVRLPGGKLRIEVPADGERGIVMRGPATCVFEGDIESGGAAGAGVTPAGEIAAVIDNAVLGVQSWRVWTGMEVHHDPELVWTTSRIPFPLFNGVLRTRSVEPGIEARIDGLVADAARRGVPLAWWITPDSTPTDLRQRLDDRGFLHADTTTGMAASIADAPLPESPAGIDVREVTTDDDLASWCQVMAPVYGFTDEARAPWQQLLAAVGYGPGHPWRHFLGLRGGRPVSTSSLFSAAGVGGLSNVATLPGARHRGAGTAVTLAALAEARRLGQTHATLCATDMAIPLYTRLGFRSLCETHVYLWSADA